MVLRHSSSRAPIQGRRPLTFPSCSKPTRPQGLWGGVQRQSPRRKALFPDPLPTASVGETELCLPGEPGHFIPKPGTAQPPCKSGATPGGTGARDCAPGPRGSRVPSLRPHLPGTDGLNLIAQRSKQRGGEDRPREHLGSGGAPSGRGCRAGESESESLQICTRGRQGFNYSFSYPHWTSRYFNITLPGRKD